MEYYKIGYEFFKKGLLLDFKEIPSGIPIKWDLIELREFVNGYRKAERDSYLPIKFEDLLKNLGDLP